MKKKLFNIHYSLFIIAAAAAISSCDKMPINGDLDGMWQIMKIQTPEGERDMKSTRAYMSIQLHLSQWDCGGIRFYAHFRHEGDSIFYYDFAHDSKHRSQADDNEWITKKEMTQDKIMDAWGIHNLDARYRIIKLNDEDLILERKDTTLTFRKF